MVCFNEAGYAQQIVGCEYGAIITDRSRSAKIADTTTSQMSNFPPKCCNEAGAANTDRRMVCFNEAGYAQQIVGCEYGAIITNRSRSAKIADTTTSQMSNSPSKCFNEAGAANTDRLLERIRIILLAKQFRRNPYSLSR
jgi:hypothetical protein